MALYDNKHWLLSHIKNSFISSDDTGICEMVMLGEDIPRSLSHATKVCCYPGADQSEGEDEMDALSHSLDIVLADMDLCSRPRSSIVQRLEKNDAECEKGERTRYIKWENVTGYDPSEFQRKDFRKKRKDEKIVLKQSLLVKQLENYPSVFRNPFLEYAKFDGDAQVGVPTRKYGIFMMMLPPAERNYPLYVVVIASARVQDLIGLICWKYTLENGDHNLGDSVDQYGLYIAEDDGEVDWDFPCLDAREIISKFGFGYLALVERQEKGTNEDSTSKERVDRQIDAGASEPRKLKVVPKDEDMKRMRGHMTAMEAPLYQSYRVFTVSKVRSRTEIQLGISGEKIEIDPVMQQRVGAKFWNRQKAVSYDIDNIAACELIESKTSNRGTLRLIYYSPSLTGTDQESSSHNHASISNYKHYDFETDLKTAEEIVQKINNILDLTTPIKRQEYLDLKDSKPHKKRIFRLGQKQ